MTNTATYWTDVRWEGEHWGRVVMGNGPEMPFSAPPDAYGHEGVLTPEDAFVAAVNTCIMMMFLWACQRFKIDLVSYSCRAEGTKQIELDRTETFTHLRLYPQIVTRTPDEKRIQRALEAAQKYSLVANSVTSAVTIEPTVTILRDS